MGNDLKVNDTTTLRPGLRVGERIDYLVLGPAGRWQGLLQVQAGRAVACSGIDQAEYDAVRRALPDVDFSLIFSSQKEQG